MVDKQLIDAPRIERHYTVRAAKTNVPRTVDFFANSGTNVAMDVGNLSLARGDAIRDRADQEAFNVWDLLGGIEIARYWVYGVLGDDEALHGAQEDALSILRSTGAQVTTELEEARDALALAVEDRSTLFSSP